MRFRNHVRVSLTPSSLFASRTGMDVMVSRFRTFATAGALVVACAGVLAGQGWIEPIRPLPTGRVEKIRSAVQVTVTGRVARVTVEEWFRNSGPIMDEGSYLYPLPGEAVFSDFSLWQGDRELKGEMMDATQARSLYESIVRRKRDPALIELAGHGLLRARVFPINPGETRKITLRYTQVLDHVGDAWRLRFASGPGAAPRSFHMTVDSADRVGSPYSPTHHVTTSRQGDRLDVTLADSSWSGDLELLLPLTRRLVGVSLLAHQPAGEADGYFMALLAPGQATDASRVRRDLVAVLDILTDGLPTVGDTDPERIADEAERQRGPFRVFSFGIGYDVNTYLLDRLTERARGTSEYIQPGADIERAVGSLAAKIASPVMTDLALSGDGAELYDLQPASLPDLFSGDEIVLFGRYRGSARGGWSITLTGRRNGHEERFTASAPTGETNFANAYVRQLWAARKAGALARDIRLHGQTPELMAALKDLALRYGILTDYTAYLVQEPNQVVVRQFERSPLPPAPQEPFGAPSVARARREAMSASASVAADAARLAAAARTSMAAPTERAGGRLFVWGA